MERKIAAGTGRLHFAVISFFFLVILSCAKQGIPPGAKEDKEPPSLVSSSPVSMSVGVPVTGPIVFVFSESMNEGSVVDNLMIVPIPSVWPSFSWRSRSKELIVNLKEPLRDSTTYIVTIGARASDMKGNQLHGTITLTFSTGSSIENGKITGRLIPFDYFGKNPEKVSGVDVVAYALARIDQRKAFSPDPRFDVPDYFTQSGTDGSYTISGLSQAVYRLFAIGDRDGDGFYSEGSDMIGVAPHDIAVAHDDSVEAPAIMVSPRDTTAVQLRSLRAPDSRRVELFFDRDIVDKGIEVDIEGLDILGLFVDSANSQMLSVATGLQENGKQYTVKTLKVIDRDSNTLATTGKAPVFTGTDRPDTTTLEIVDRGPTVLTPEGGPVRLVFNRVLALPERPDPLRPLRQAHSATSQSASATSSGFALADDFSGENLVVTRTAPNVLSITSSDGWKEKYRYSILLDTDSDPVDGDLTESVPSRSIRGVAGNRLPDSGRQLVFRVAPSDTLGYIKGSIDDKTDSDSSRWRYDSSRYAPDAAGAADSLRSIAASYRILLKHIDTGTMLDIPAKIDRSQVSGVRSQESIINSQVSGGALSWSSGPVLPGLYTALAFRNTDGDLMQHDGMVSRGSVNPYSPAVPFAAASPDTIKVTSRWTTEDIRFIFK